MSNLLKNIKGPRNLTLVLELILDLSKVTPVYLDHWPGVSVAAHLGLTSTLQGDTALTCL